MAAEGRSHGLSSLFTGTVPAAFKAFFSFYIFFLHPFIVRFLFAIFSFSLSTLSSLLFIKLRELQKLSVQFMLEASDS